MTQVSIASLTSTARATIDILIEAVGGTAIDICRPLLDDIGIAFGMEHVTIKFLDTSDSNSSLIPGELMYRFPGLAGGGKNRKFVVDKVTPIVPGLVDKTPLAKVHIVVMGAGGASGAGAGPALIEERLKRGHNVVAMVVGSASGSVTELGNTEATLRTLNNHARKYNTPIPMFYRQNDEENTIGMVDNALRSAIKAFSAFFSNLNHGIEETDIKHFLNYTKVPRAKDIAPALVNIDWMINEIDVPEHVQVVSQATLVLDMDRDSATDSAHEGVLYRTTGEMHGDLATSLKSSNEAAKEVHYLLMRGDVAQRVALLADSIKKMEEAAAKAASKALDLAPELDGNDGVVY